MRLTKLTLLVLISTMVITTSSVTRAQSIRAGRPCAAGPFLTVADSGWLHVAFTASSCTDAAMEACNSRAAEVKRDCEYRGEDGGTAYSSCRCQSIRYARDCYRDAGCSVGEALFTEVSPECFGIQ